jgi:beta-glucosidase
MTMNFDDMSSYDYKTKKAYVLDSGDYILSLRSDAHTVKNNLTYTYNQNSTIVYDDTARSTDTTAATNLFDDVTNGDGNINTTFPYLSINDWEGTFPNKTKSSNLKASDSVVALLNNDSHGSTIDLDNDPTVDATFKQGVENGVILDSVAGITDPESSLWDDLVDHMSIDEMN